MKDDDTARIVLAIWLGRGKLTFAISEHIATDIGK